MNFVTWSIRNPVPVIVLFIALTVAGLISFPKLGVLDRPDIEFPAVVVTVTYPGVAPTQMESEITRKVEDAVATIAGIEQMTSTVDEGASTTSIEFRFGTDLSAALDDVRDAMTRIRSDLPPDANEPIVSRVTTAGGAIVTWSVASDSMSARSGMSRPIPTLSSRLAVNPSSTTSGTKRTYPAAIFASGPSGPCVPKGNKRLPRVRQMLTLLPGRGLDRWRWSYGDFVANRTLGAGLPRS